MVKAEVLRCCCLWPCDWGQKCIPRPHTCYGRLKALTELFPALYSASLEVFSFQRWRLTKKSIFYALAASSWKRNIKRSFTTIIIIIIIRHHHQNLHDDVIVLCKRSTRTDQQFLNLVWKVYFVKISHKLDSMFDRRFIQCGHRATSALSLYFSTTNVKIQNCWSVRVLLLQSIISSSSCWSWWWSSVVPPLWMILVEKKASRP